MREKYEYKNTSETYYEIRQSAVLLVLKLLGIEGGMLLAHFLIGKLLTITNTHGINFLGMDLETWELILFHVTNSILLLSVILSWLYTYYVISGYTLSKMKGIINKEKQSFDLRGVQEIRVTQGVFAQIGRYGTICLENPLIGETIMLKNIGNPHVYEKYLQKQQKNFTETIHNPAVISQVTQKG